MAIIDRYKTVWRHSRRLKLTADHPDALRRQFDALDLLGRVKTIATEPQMTSLVIAASQAAWPTTQQQRLARSLRVAARIEIIALH